MISLKISTWNINGIRAILKKGNLINYIKHSSPDIICLNEIRIDQQTLKNLEISNFFSNYPYQNWSCCDKKGYAGVAILSKIQPLKTFDFFPNHNEDNNIKAKEFNGRVAIMEFNNFNLVALYSPNSGGNLQNLSFRIDNWENHLRKSVKKLEKQTIICGDLNVALSEIDLFNPKGNHNNPGFTDLERENFGYLLKEGFYDCFRQKYPEKIKYTWWTPRSKLARQENKGWRLDYFLMEEKGENKFVDCFIRDDVYGSDHCPVELIAEVKN